jgi:hypothetical protein
VDVRTIATTEEHLNYRQAKSAVCKQSTSKLLKACAVKLGRTLMMQPLLVRVVYNTASACAHNEAHRLS